MKNLGGRTSLVLTVLRTNITDPRRSVRQIGGKAYFKGNTNVNIVKAK